MNADQMLTILRDGTADQRRSFIASLPPSSFKDMALMLMQGRQPGAVVLALNPLITQYCAGADPEIGAQLALVTHTLAVETYESGRDPGLLPMTLSGLAYQHANALNLLGRSEEVLSFTERVIPYYERLAKQRKPLPGLDEARTAQAHLGEQQNVQSLKTARLGALVNAQRIDEAKQLLEDPTLRGNPASDIEIDRLEKKIAVMTGDITRLADEQKPADNARQVMADALLRLLKPTDLSPDLLKGLQGALQRAPSSEPSTLEGNKTLREVLDIGEGMLTRGNQVANEWTLKRQVREASSIFVSKPTPEQIRSSLAELEQALAGAREKGLFDVQNDALWSIYLCHSRLHQPSPAADTLIELRGSLERLRDGIADPVKRGGIFSQYPHLSGALCEKLHDSGRAEDLLIAIEASKGRGIADLLTRKFSKIVRDADVYESAAQLPSLARSHRFHYLTYYVDTEKAYGVLVSKKGEIHLLSPLSMPRTEIRELAGLADPDLWGRPLDYDASMTAPDVSRTLSPLAAALEPLMDQRVLAAGDHLCYSPHDSFHNVPFQYLRLRGKHLIDFFSVSRAHNAFQVARLLSEAAAERPKEYCGFMVPSVQDRRATNWNNREANLARPLAWLAKHLGGEDYREGKASIDRLNSLDLRGRVVHFSTHGIFPRIGPKQNPFTESGLVMANSGRLPDEDAIGAGDRSSVLTPQKVFDQKLDLRASHVSVMACVSGLARDGLGGEALGMDWAFLQAGAASLLSSHWYVSAGSAAEFFALFYEAWLAKKMGRGEAMRETVRHLRRKGKDAGGGRYGWAAFSLAGDWR